MAGYFVKPPDGPIGPGNDHFDVLHEDYPALTLLLAGRGKDHPAGEMAPMTVMLFFDSGKLKFCFSGKHSLQVAFGSVKNPGDVMGSLEGSIVNGEFEWKSRRR